MQSVCEHCVQSRVRCVYTEHSMGPGVRVARACKGERDRAEMPTCTREGVSTLGKLPFRGWSDERGKERRGLTLSYLQNGFHSRVPLHMRMWKRRWLSSSFFVKLSQNQSLTLSLVPLVNIYILSIGRNALLNVAKTLYEISTPSPPLGFTSFRLFRATVPRSFLLNLNSSINEIDFFRINGITPKLDSLYRLRILTITDTNPNNYYRYREFYLRFLYTCFFFFSSIRSRLSSPILLKNTHRFLKVWQSQRPGKTVPAYS